MKTKPFSPFAAALLFTGLLMSTLPLIFSRVYPVPDVLKGILTGVGLALEVIALTRLNRLKRCQRA